MRKLNQIQKFLDKINEYIPKVKNPEQLLKLHEKCENLAIELNDEQEREEQIQNHT